MTEEDKDDARHREVLEAIEKARQQDSFEHGSIITAGREQNKETRAHIGSEVAVVEKELRFFKNFQERMLNAMRRFLERMGIRSDDL